MPQYPNPYETLAIPVSSSTADIVDQGTRLIAAESNEDRRRQYRAAIEALTTHPQDPAYHAFWEPPGTAYRNAAEHEYVARFARDPVDRAALNERAAAFLSGCTGARLLQTVSPAPQIPVPGPPHPGVTPQTPLTIAFDSCDLFP